MDRVRCIDDCGLAQLELGQLYTIKHVLPGGLLVFVEFTRIRAFHPAGFTLVDPHCRHDRGVKAGRLHQFRRIFDVTNGGRPTPAASTASAPTAGTRRKSRKVLAGT
jgi:hypothetical protein